MKKWTFLLSLAMAMLLLFGTAAFAFDDLPEGGDRDKIRSLQERGIVNGYGTSFMANKKLNNAEGVHLIVKAMDLSLAAFLFIKEPLASDSFDNIPNDAWYANSFVIAAVNGLNLPRDIDPQAEMTREAYAHYLLSALLIKGDYPFTKMLVHVADEADVNPDYRHSLQLLLNAKIVELDQERMFHPKKPITRRDAAVLAYNTLEFMKVHSQPLPGGGVTVDETVTLTSARINDEVNKVTLSWGEKPNAGYTLTITGIVFKDGKTAEIHYKLGTPEKDKMYAQVITTPQADTYLASGYKPIPVQDKKASIEAPAG
jgi:hypothetical protein